MNFGGVAPNPNFASVMAGGGSVSPAMAFLSSIAHSTARIAQIEQEELNNIRHMVPPGTARAVPPAQPPPWAPPGTMQAPGAPPGIDIPPMPGGGGGSAAWPGWAVSGGGGGGGGGGGRGVGAGGGGGWRRGGRMHVPFASAIGLGATSELLTGGVTLAAAGYAAEELLSMPQIIGSKEGAALASAAPYFGLRMQTAALGRAGGFSGNGLLGQFYQGLKPPAWMTRLGLGPGESDKMLSDFGFVQGSAGASRSVVENLARMSFIPGLSGLPAGAMAQSAGEAASPGIVSGDAKGIAAFTRQMAPVLADAVAQGGNRIQILHAINQTIARAAVGGYSNPLTAIGVGRVMEQTMGAPGGRSGAAGMSLLHGAGRFLSGVGTQPLPTIAMATLLPQLGTPAALKAFLDKGQPGAYEMMTGPAGVRQGYAASVQDYFAAYNSGDMNTASFILGNLTNALPGDRLLFAEHAADLSFPRGSPEWKRFVEVQTGVTPMVLNAALSGQAGRQVGRLPGGPMGSIGVRANNPLNLSFAHQAGTSGYHTMASGRKEAVFRTMQGGFAAGEKQLLADQGRGAHSVAQLLQMWTPGGKYNAAHAREIAQAMGVGPDTPIDLHNPATMNSFAGLLANIESPGWKGGLQSATSNTLGVPGAVNMPTNTLSSIANVKAGGMFGSHTTAMEVNYLIAGLNSMLATLVKGSATFLNALEKANAELGQAVIDNPSGNFMGP